MILNDSMQSIDSGIVDRVHRCTRDKHNWLDGSVCSGTYDQ